MFHLLEQQLRLPCSKALRQPWAYRSWKYCHCTDNQFSRTGRSAQRLRPFSLPLSASSSGFATHALALAEAPAAPVRDIRPLMETKMTFGKALLACGETTAPSSSVVHQRKHLIHQRHWPSRLRSATVSRRWQMLSFLRAPRGTAQDFVPNLIRDIPTDFRRNGPVRPSPADSLPCRLQMRPLRSRQHHAVMQGKPPCSPTITKSSKSARTQTRKP